MTHRKIHFIKKLRNCFLKLVYLKLHVPYLSKKPVNSVSAL